MNIMAIPRKQLVDKDKPGFYHCTNRCVRRAYLCGTDEYSGKNYDHRKTWFERRMFELCNIFAIDIFAFAIMDNHYHLVLYLDPITPQRWSDAEVAERWLQAYPGNLDLPKNAERRELVKRVLMSNDQKLDLYRKRLGSLSWFMARLNEPLAKASNLEDSCTGKFWEGRFSSQALLDEAAVLSCMTYVDLNPVRAKITQKLEESSHTSIQQRLIKLSSNNSPDIASTGLESIIGRTGVKKLSISVEEYVQLVEWTGRSIIYPKKGSIPSNLPSVFERYRLKQKNWLDQITNYAVNYYYFVGHITKISKKAEQLNVRSLRGSNAAKQLYFQN